MSCGTISSRGCISQHGLQAPDPANTCDIILMVSTTFNYLLDQLVVKAGGEGPAWTEVDECHSMWVHQDLIANPRSTRKWNEFLRADPDTRDPCGDVPLPLDWRLPADEVRPEVVPEPRVPDLGDTDSEHLPELAANDPVDVRGGGP